MLNRKPTGAKKLYIIGTGKVQIYGTNNAFCPFKTPSGGGDVTVDGEVVNGKDGFSPIITVAEDTADSYALSITTATGTFSTPNLKGEKGDTGEQGAQGEKGDKGDTGAQGERGEAFTYDDFTEEQLAALKGEKGDTGARGEKGEKGDTGEQGIQGVQGVPGEKGADGTTYVPSIGAVTTVDSTAEASASVELDEDNKKAVFNFSIPKGEKGDDYYFTLEPATSTVLGGVLSGGDISVDESGAVTVNSVNGKTIGTDVPENAVFTDTVYTLPTASESELGGVKVDGTTVKIDENGVISAEGDYVPVSGGTMEGALVAQSNTDYTVAQVRNVIISSEAPSGTAPEGTIWYQYEVTE